MGFLRRIRGIVGTAFTWAAAWGLVGALVYAVATQFWDLPADAPVMSMMLTGALFFALYGLMAGGAFALVLLVTERKRTLQHLTLRRMAAWGALGSILMAASAFLSVGFSRESALFALVSALLGGGCAAGSLSLARRELPSQASTGAGFLSPERRARIVSDSGS